MYELHKISLNQARLADFPLYCDTILKVNYIANVGIRWQYFACMKTDSVAFKVMFESLVVVHDVNIIPLENFTD